MALTTSNDTVAYTKTGSGGQRLADVVVSVNTDGSTRASVADNADGVAAVSTLTRLANAARNYLFNGTTWDRVRSVITGTDSVGTGIAAVGLVAQFDDVASSAVTENQFANVRISGARALYAEIGPYTVTRVTADGQIKGSAGFVHAISIGAITATPTAGLLTIYDSLTETGTVLFAGWIFATQTPTTIILNAKAATGIFVGYDATLTNVSVSVSFR